MLTSMTSSSSFAEGTTPKKGGLQLTKCIQPNCNYFSYNKGDFKIHMDKHLDIRYKCTLCAKNFGSDKPRRTHFRTVHLGQAWSICSFPNCNFSHNDHGVTRIHRYIEHGLGEAPKCQHPDCKDRDNPDLFISATDKWELNCQGSSSPKFYSFAEGDVDLIYHKSSGDSASVESWKKLFGRHVIDIDISDQQKLVHQKLLRGW